MGVFSDITLTWNGAAHTVASNRVMGLISEIEEVATIDELYAIRPRVAGGEGLKITRLAAAYGVALRYAGVRTEQDEDGRKVTRPISNEEVYAGLLSSATQAQVVTALDALLRMMMPPEALMTKGVAAASPGNRKRRRAASSSRRRTRKP